jgi:hypothetical protein
LIKLFFHLINYFPIWSNYFPIWSNYFPSD